MASETEIRIRAGLDDDAAEILALIAPFVQQRSLLPRDESEIRRLSRDGFVAEQDGRIVGFSAIEIYSRKMAEIQCLAVSAEAQGKGVGKRLVKSCIELAEARGIVELMAITASEELFTACGFSYSMPDQKKALFIQTRDPH